MTGEQTGPFAQVAVGRPVRGDFTYAVPEQMRGALRPGQRLQVPFGRGSALGFYLGPAEVPDASVQVRAIERVLEPSPALPPDVLALLRFAATHYRYPLGEALRSALPPGLAQPEASEEGRFETVAYVAALPGADVSKLGRAPAQAAALGYLLAVGGRVPVEEVAHAVPGAKPALKKLAERGWVRLEEVEQAPESPDALKDAHGLSLTPEQAQSVDALTASLEAGGFQPWLLHGVTGSGKTEVYLRLVERALALGKGSLVLVPEIALTPQLVGRFRGRFGSAVAVLHSGLKDRERLRHWQRLRAGEVRIAVGVRSAVFAPVPDLGLLVVDEEHDPSFKQEEKLRYHARDLAVVRAKQAEAVVVLGSATPSLETLENVERGRYRKLSLTRRVDDRPLPEVSLIDLRRVRPRTGAVEDEPPILAPPLLEAMGEVLAKGQQVILFINRRGHSTFFLCEVCGESVKCTDCDVCLTHHLSQRRAMCHYCGRTRPAPERCASCGGRLLKLGVGTERVEAEVAERFPRARVARLDRDSATTAERLTEMLSAFARRELDVLIGTQMVAKGHDFPGVTLVCVVMADTALALPDFRAAERTFHLLTQVAGRAGRGKDPGRVLVQTYHPESDPVRCVVQHDFQTFIQGELSRRRALAYPPFTRLAAVRVEGADPGATAEAARLLGERIARRMPPAEQGVRLLGPAPAPLARLKGKSRWQLLVKGPTHSALHPLLREVERALNDPRLAKVRVVIDVDPGAML